MKVHDDLTRKEMMNELERVSRTFDKKIHDCLVVVILSHGYPGKAESLIEKNWEKS